MKTLVILVCLSLAGYASACSCVYATNAQKFCNADFAVLVKVLNQPMSFSNYRVYKIDLLHTYRSNSAGTVNTQYLFTPLYSAACGVFLQPGKYYIISGSYIYGVWMSTNLCNLRLAYNYNPITLYQAPSCPAIPLPYEKEAAEPDKTVA